MKLEQLLRTRQDDFFHTERIITWMSEQEIHEIAELNILPKEEIMGAASSLTEAEKKDLDNMITWVRTNPHLRCRIVRISLRTCFSSFI